MTIVIVPMVLMNQEHLHAQEAHIFALTLVMFLFRSHLLELMMIYAVSSVCKLVFIGLTHIQHLIVYILSDCCDGSDEFSTNVNCQNTCDELGRAAREETERLTKLAREGYQKRLEMSQKGKEIKQEKDLEKAKLESERVNAEALREAKRKIKDEVEIPEKEALERHRLAQEELRKQREEAENQKAENEADNMFNLLDSNGDGKVTIDEIKVRQTFDRNKDGEVSDEEAMFFLDMQEEMTKEEFIGTGWSIAKPFFLMEQGMFTPPEQHKEEQDVEENQGEETDGDVNQDNNEPENKEHGGNEEQDDYQEQGLDEPDEEEEREESAPAPAPELEYDEETKQLIDRKNDNIYFFVQTDTMSVKVRTVIQ